MGPRPFGHGNIAVSTVRLDLVDIDVNGFNGAATFRSRKLSTSPRRQD